MFCCENAKQLQNEKGAREDQRKTQKETSISSYEEYTVTLFQRRFKHQIPHNETLPKALWYNQSQSPSKKNQGNRNCYCCKL